MTTIRHPALLLIATLALLPVKAFAQAAPVGVVTAQQGTATVARVGSGPPAPLKFKDDVFVDDRITTHDRSLARILLGGRATVTVREHSSLTITAAPGTATLGLAQGKLALAVTKDAMKPRDSVEIRTPTIVMAVRGTVVVAEVSPGSTTDGTPDVTVCTVLRGTVEVIRFDAVSRRPLGPPMTLGALQSVTVTGSAPPQLRTITPEAARQIAKEYETPLAPAAAAATAAVAEGEAQKAAESVDELLQSPTPRTALPASSRSDMTSTTSGALSTDSGTLSSTLKAKLPKPSKSPK